MNLVCVDVGVLRVQQGCRKAAGGLLRVQQVRRKVAGRVLPYADGVSQGARLLYIYNVGNRLGCSGRSGMRRRCVGFANMDGDGMVIEACELGGTVVCLAGRRAVCIFLGFTPPPP
jgi:hypothetical protein